MSCEPPRWQRGEVLMLAGVRISVGRSESRSRQPGIGFCSVTAQPDRERPRVLQTLSQPQIGGVDFLDSPCFALSAI